MALNGSTEALVNAQSRQIDKSFQESYQQSLLLGENWVKGHYKEVKSAKEAVHFPFYGDTSDPTEVNPREMAALKQLLGYFLELSTARFKDAIRVPRDVFWDDASDLGLIQDQVNKLAETYALLYKIMAADILNTGHTAAVQTYDLEPLFSNTHEIGASGVFDNLLAGTGVTVAALTTDLEAAYTAMMLFPTDTGRRRGSNNPTHLVYHPSIRFRVAEVLFNTQSALDNKNTENVHAKLLVPYEENRLTDLNDHFCFRSVGSEKPFIAISHPQLDQAKIVPEVRDDSEAVLKFDEFRWWIEGKRKLHPTHPHLWIKTVNA